MRISSIILGNNINALKSSSIFKVGRLNHVAMAVPNLEESSLLWKNVFGANVSEPINLPEHGVTTVFIELQNTKFELLHPFGDQR